LNFHSNGRILNRETKLLFSDSSVWILIFVYLAFVAYGALQGIRAVRTDHAVIARSRAQYAERWSAIERHARAAGSQGAQTWGSWRSASLAGSEQGGSVVWLSPGELGALNRGHAERQDSVRAVSLYDSPVDPPLENPVNVMYGAMDFGFVAVWLLPLVSILLAFQSLGRDREQGVWQLVLSTGASPRSLILVRLLIPASIVLLITFVGSAVALGFTSKAFGAAWLLWVIVMAAYCLFWTMLAAWVGLSSSSSGRQLLILGGLWMASVWVVPGLLQSACELAVPRVTPVEGLLAAREAQISSSQKAANLMKAVYAEHPGWIPDADLVRRMNLPVPGGPRRRDARNVYSAYLVGEQAAEPNRFVMSRRRSRVEDLSNRLSAVSPLLSVQYLTEELAGTSPGRYEWFGRHTENYIQQWRHFFAEKIWRLKDLELSDVERRPQYVEPAESLTGILARTIWPGVGLAFWFVVVMGAFVRRLQRSLVP
jgi:ABC-2 type transport system permease protein